MKVTRYFLTVTTFCLALAGVAATKANGRIIERGYTQDGPKGHCTIDSGIDCPGGINLCNDGNGSRLFMKNTTGPCIIGLYKN